MVGERTNHRKRVRRIRRAVEKVGGKGWRGEEDGRCLVFFFVLAPSILLLFFFFTLFFFSSFFWLLCFLLTIGFPSIDISSGQHAGLRERVELSDQTLKVPLLSVLLFSWLCQRLDIDQMSDRFPPLRFPLFTLLHLIAHCVCVCVNNPVESLANVTRRR